LDQRGLDENLTVRNCLIYSGLVVLSECMQVKVWQCP